MVTQAKVCRMQCVYIVNQRMGFCVRVNRVKKRNKIAGHEKLIATGFYPVLGTSLPENN